MVAKVFWSSCFCCSWAYCCGLKVENFLRLLLRDQLTRRLSHLLTGLSLDKIASMLSLLTLSMLFETSSMANPLTRVVLDSLWRFKVDEFSSFFLLGLLM